MEVYIKKRSILLAKVRKRLETVKNQPDDVSSEIECRERIEQLNQLNQDFVHTTKEIENSVKCTDEHLQKLLDEEEEFKTNYFFLKNHYQQQLNDDPNVTMKEEARNTEVQTLLQSVQLLAATVTNSQNNPAPIIIRSQNRLQPPVLKKFTGDPADWPEFLDLFTSMVHNQADIPDVEKFTYLKSHLSDYALTIVENIKITSENYKMAWKTLEDTFNRPRCIVRGHLERLFHLPNQPTQWTTKDVENFVITTFGALHVLERLDSKTAFDMLVDYIISTKLDDRSRQRWHRETDAMENISIDLIKKFIKECKSMSDAIVMSKSSKPNYPKVHSVINPKPQKSQFQIICFKCSENHTLFNCPQFRNFSVQQRKDFVLSQKLCSNCLYKHDTDQCSSKKTCNVCNNRHNTLLHTNYQEQIQAQISNQAQNSNEAQNSNQVQNSNVTQNISPNIAQNTDVPILHVQNQNNQTISASNSNISGYRVPNYDFYNQRFVNFSKKDMPNVLLSTAIVLVRDRNWEWQPCRAVLDNGSQASFISEACAQRLRLPRKGLDMSFTGIDSSYVGKARGQVKLCIRSRFSQETAEICPRAYILKKVTSDLPNQNFSVNNLEKLENIPLADPRFNISGSIDILIGNDYFLEILRDGRDQLPNGLKLQNTMFGWIVGGNLPDDQSEFEPRSFHCVLNPFQKPKIYQKQSKNFQFSKTYRSHTLLSRAACSRS